MGIRRTKETSQNPAPIHDTPARAKRPEAWLLSPTASQFLLRVSEKEDFDLRLVFSNQKSEESQALFGVKERRLSED